MFSLSQIYSSALTLPFGSQDFLFLYLSGAFKPIYNSAKGRLSGSFTAELSASLCLINPLKGSVRN